jgi:hypothetical protein
MNKKIKGSKGRPIGFRLSEASKRAISESKKGQRHKESTKDKIARSLKTYFRKKYPLSKELFRTYNNMEDLDATEWIQDVREDIDDIHDVLTQRMIFSRLRIEISCGDNIEELLSHSITPELLLMIKEKLENGEEE